MRCRIRHKWEYSTERWDIGKEGSGAHITLNFRICKRCYLKQRQELNGFDWFDVDLSKHEIREIKLRKLGL
jgi:hypothetical protein